MQKQSVDTLAEYACPACAAAASAGEASGFSGKKTERTEASRKALLTRLKRIEGQVRGLQGMVEKDAYCPDILIQVSAVNSALNSFSRELLSSHIRGCVRRDMLSGDDGAVEELCRLLQRLMK